MNPKNIEILSTLITNTIPKWEDLPEIDLYMDQVIALMEKYLQNSNTPDTKLITSSMINNYVKLGIMPAPKKKKYSREHLAYLVIICSLKQVMPISTIKEMIENKLKTNTISELLDLYSKLYEITFQTIIKTCSESISSSILNQNNLTDISIFTAIAASNCVTISNLLFSKENEENKFSNKKQNSSI